MITVTVIGKEELRARIDAMPDKVHTALLRAITSLALQLEAHVKQDKLEGQVLNHITGRLQGSIMHDVIDQGTRITGRVYSNTTVNYAAIHEYGGQIPDRYPVNAQALHFFIGGKEVFAKFARGFTMPERSFLRSSLQDYRQIIINGMTNAVTSALGEA